MFSISSVSASTSKTWLIDTGATHHVCCNLDNFIDYVSLINAFVTLPNKQKVHILKNCSFRVSLDLLLHSVLFVPGFSYNLLYVSSLLSYGDCTV